MTELLIIIGIGTGAAIVLWASSRNRAPVPTEYYEDDMIMTEAELQAQTYGATALTQPRPHFIVDQWYPESDIEDLLWSLGYTQAQVKQALNHGYVSIFCNGVSGAFQHYGEWIDPIVYMCEAFNPHADTSSVDRWGRPPTEDERRKAIWR